MEKKTMSTKNQESNSSESALAPRQETLPAQNGVGNIDGLEDIDREDIIIPRLRIVQPTSREATNGVPAGSFVSNLDGSAFEQCRIVPLSWKKGRILFNEGDEKPSCRSNDGLMPSDRIASPVSECCAKRINGSLKTVCPSAQWLDDAPPACAQTYQLCALNLDLSESPFLVGFKGTSIRPVKTLISFFVQRKMPPYSYSCQMSLRKETNRRGTFFVAEFGKYEPIDPPDRYKVIYQEMKGYSTPAPATDEDLPF